MDQNRGSLCSGIGGQNGPESPVFLSQLKYRNFEEVYEENLLNELITSYFRDLMFNGNNDLTRINRSVSFERHKVLNWLRTYFEEEAEVSGELWDNTDTST